MFFRKIPATFSVVGLVVRSGNTFGGKNENQSQPVQCCAYLAIEVAENT
jgi:hypothetical protein